MKQTALVVLFFFSINFGHAQFYERNAIYSAGELNIGNYIGIDLSLNYVLAEKYSFKIGYTGSIRQPTSQPADYTSGMKGILFFGMANPYDQLANYQLGVGRIVNFNKKGTIRANLSVGLGYASIREPGNWERTDSGFLVENYNWDYSKYNTISLIINPKIEFPFTRFYGITVSPMLQLNKDRTYFGIGIGQMLGFLRRSREEDI